MMWIDNVFNSYMDMEWYSMLIAISGSRWLDVINYGI